MKQEELVARRKVVDEALMRCANLVAILQYLFPDLEDRQQPLRVRIFKEYTNALAEYEIASDEYAAALKRQGFTT